MAGQVGLGRKQLGEFCQMPRNEGEILNVQPEETHLHVSREVAIREPHNERNS